MVMTTRTAGSSSIHLFHIHSVQAGHTEMKTGHSSKELHDTSHTPGPSLTQGAWQEPPGTLEERAHNCHQDNKVTLCQL